MNYILAMGSYFDINFFEHEFNTLYSSNDTECQISSYFLQFTQYTTLEEFAFLQSFIVMNEDTQGNFNIKVRDLQTQTILDADMVDEMNEELLDES
jgi:hypothetical protein